MNSAPNSQPIRQTRRHWRERPSEKMRVNSGGSSKYSATTFTPPSEMSVTMQSRGKPPVPNWILARLLQIRRSLLRRFANISILPPSLPTHSNITEVLQNNPWDMLSANSRNLSFIFERILSIGWMRPNLARPELPPRQLPQPQNPVLICRGAQRRISRAQDLHINHKRCAGTTAWVTTPSPSEGKSFALLAEFTHHPFRLRKRRGRSSPTTPSDAHLRCCWARPSPRL